MHFLEFKKKFALHGKETIVASSERKSSKIVSFEKTVIDARMYYVYSIENSRIFRYNKALSKISRRKYRVNSSEFLKFPEVLISLRFDPRFERIPSVDKQSCDHLISDDIASR